MINETIYDLPESLRDSLLEYLCQRPYKEVAEGIQAILKLVPASKTMTSFEEAL